MGQAGAVVIPFMDDENLGLVFEAPEGGGMDDAVPVPLEAGPVRMFLLFVKAPARLGGEGRVRSQNLAFLRFKLFSCDDSFLLLLKDDGQHPATGKSPSPRQGSA